ncbi:MAG: right-handed parallel beta-helix repeat-containing protein, partial [Sedimentisphaerales bacterium]
KNHFGSVYFPSANQWTPSPLHSYGRRENPMGSYNCLVNLNGHRHLAGKTLLYMIDALYPSRNQNTSQGYVIKYLSFGDDWLSSLFVSQDPVAIDSVALDFMRNEPRCTEVTGNPDNYLHEMALADNPPSGTFYDPEGDGTRLTSLGVHEHWNNPIDKQYSRNLGIGNGIELATPELTSPDGPVENLNSAKRYDYIRHAIMEAEPNDQIVVNPGIYNENINFSGKNITVSSIDPNDPNVVSATVIYGSNQAVSFSGGEDANCVLAGFTITGAKIGLYCSNASPAIINCRIVANEGAGIKLLNDSNPTIINCIIAGNKAVGIEMWTDRRGRAPKFSYATIINCTIVENLQHGISQGKPTVINSIIYNNGLGNGFVQIDSPDATVIYSDVLGGWPGAGNIDADPLFVQPGYWDDGGSPQDSSDDFWVEGDYHLLWDSPCVNAGDPAITYDIVKTDIDGQPRIIDGRVDMGCDELDSRL